jgi:hypothetical protein
MKYMDDMDAHDGQILLWYSLARGRRKRKGRGRREELKGRDIYQKEKGERGGAKENGRE